MHNRDTWASTELMGCYNFPSSAPVGAGAAPVYSRSYSMLVAVTHYAKGRWEYSCGSSELRWLTVASWGLQHMTVQG